MLPAGYYSRTKQTIYCSRFRAIISPGHLLQCALASFRPQILKECVVPLAEARQKGAGSGDLRKLLSPSLAAGTSQRHQDFLSLLDTTGGWEGRREEDVGSHLPFETGAAQCPPPYHHQGFGLHCC